MNRRLLNYLSALLLFSVLLSGLARADVFITEIADPNNDSGARYVELYNNGAEAVDFSAGWALQRWTNANTDPQTAVALTGTIPAGGFYIISPNGSEFSTVYGKDANQDIGTGGPADSNGDDNIALLDASGTIVDLFGVPGEDGSGTAHEFEDGRAERVATVTAGANPWVASEWNIDNDSGGGDGAQDAPAGFDPGAWIGAPVGDAPPAISNVQRNILIPGADDNTTVTADVTDDSGLTKVELRYMVNDGTPVVVSMTNTSGDSYSAEIPASAYVSGDRVAYWIHAEDDAAQNNENSQDHFVAGTIDIGSLHSVDANGRSIYMRYYVKISGTATVGSGTFSSSSLDVYFQDATGGINLFKQGADSIVFTLGNAYTVSGKIDQYNGKLEIIPDNAGTDVVDNGAGTVPLPLVKTIAEILAAPETYEGMLLKIVDATVTSGSWPSAGNSTNLTISDDGSKNTLTMRIDSDTDIDGSNEGTYPVTVTGIVGQYDYSSPHTSGYQILPRSTADLEWTPSAITGLIINEIMASNDAAFADENGEYDDWIEIYNANNYSVNIGGLYLTDDLGEPTQVQVPATAPDTTTIPAGGFLVLWADKQSEQGVLHLEFKLSSGGEQVGLAQVLGNDTTFIDSLTFGPQWADTSYGYISDGSGDRAYFNPATPGETNANGIVVVGIRETPNPAITDYHLAQNFPNPFNPATTIEFSVPVAGHATLTVFSITGQKAAVLLDKEVSAGTVTVNWDASHLASGVYFYELKSGPYSAVKKMLLTK